MGDFNIDLLKSETDNKSLVFYNNLSSHFLHRMFHNPTRLHSRTLTIFFSTLEYQSNSGNILIELSDHLIQFLIIEGFVKEKFYPEINLYKRDFSHFNEKEFEEIVINGSNWEQICDLAKHNPNLSPG